MDKLTDYRHIIQTLLLDRGRLKLSYGDVDTEVAFDKERDHYSHYWPSKVRY